MTTFEPIAYEPRPIVPRNPMRHEDWTVKRYDVLYKADRIDEPTFAGGLRLALDALPSPARTESRPGVGFVICHHGNGRDYVVLSWWDNENELFQRVFIRPFDEPSWHDGTGAGSFCVWDAQVIAFERDAYVAHVLVADPDLDAYVGATTTWSPL